jgi:hypothetical protein
VLLGRRRDDPLPDQATHGKPVWVLSLQRPCDIDRSDLAVVLPIESAHLDIETSSLPIQRLKIRIPIDISLAARQVSGPAFKVIFDTQ